MPVLHVRKDELSVKPRESEGMLNIEYSVDMSTHLAMLTPLYSLNFEGVFLARVVTHFGMDHCLCLQ